jgi:hypothetical protein
MFPRACVSRLALWRHDHCWSTIDRGQPSLRVDGHRCVRNGIKREALSQGVESSGGTQNHHTKPHSPRARQNPFEGALPKGTATPKRRGKSVSENFVRPRDLPTPQEGAGEKPWYPEAVVYGTRPSVARSAPLPPAAVSVAVVGSAADPLSPAVRQVCSPRAAAAV